MTKATYRVVYLGSWFQRAKGLSWRGSMTYTCRLEQDAEGLHTEPQAGIQENKQNDACFWNPPKWHTSSCRATSPKPTPTLLPWEPNIQRQRPWGDISFRPVQCGFSLFLFDPCILWKCLSSTSSETFVLSSDVVSYDQGAHSRTSGMEFALWTRTWFILKLPGFGAPEFCPLAAA